MDWILKYITLDNLMKYVPIILLLLVSWTFWGKSWGMEWINKITRKKEGKQK